MRGGFFARGLIYGIIGGLALDLALGAGGGSTTNQQGALRLVASQPLGDLALAAAAVGLLAYALWKLAQAAFGRGPEGGGGPRWSERVANLAGGLTYLGFFVVAAGAISGGEANASAQQRAAAADVLGWPGGPVLVAAAGAILVAVSVSQIREGFTGHFCRQVKTGEMDPRVLRAFSVLGRVGLVSRALVFALVGWFLVRTAVDCDANKAIGIDGALRAVTREAYGAWLLGLVAVGLIAFALFSFAEGVYRRL